MTEFDPITASVYAKVVDVLGVVFGISPVDIQFDKKLIEGLGFDSLDIVEFVMALEDEFGIEIQDEDAEKILTIGDAVAEIQKAQESRVFPIQLLPEESPIDTNPPRLLSIENRLTMDQVFEAIRQERANQDLKWGVNKPQSLPGYFLVAKKELEEAEDGWLKNLPGKSAPLNELVQVAAVVVAALERYGTTGNTISTNDIAVPQISPTMTE